MNRSCHVLLLLASAITSGCASTKAYLADRGRDAADVFTVSVGVGAGVKARVGPMHAGLAAMHDTMGLQGGGVFRYPVNQRCLDTLDLETTFSLAEVFSLPGDKRFKSFEVRQEVNPLFSRLDPYWFEPDENHPLLHPYYTQIELAGGLVGTLRLGFNPGELLDFILGWTTIDMYHDDLGMGKLRNEKAEAEATER